MKKIINRMALCSLITVVIFSQFNNSDLFAETAKIYVKPEDMKLDNIVKRNEIEKYYSEYKKIERIVFGKKIEIKLFKVLDENNSLFFDGCPYYFAEVSADDVKKYEELGRYVGEDVVSFLEKPENIICLGVHMGGSSSGALKLLSLEKETFLVSIGFIENIEKSDAGENIFYNNNRIFESTPYFAHCCFPSIKEYYRIEKAKLVLDCRVKISEAEIDRLIQRIAEYSKDIPGDNELLKIIVEKYLYYRIVEKEKEGWEKLKKDLCFYNDKYIWLGTKDKKEINEIVKTLKDRIDSYDKYNKK
ncbi:MAG: hypothetical protein A2231_12550 [Candidatus Firestonebacteria bacterium RIFOXYA2_FULL_40_8]|nr:MAG: hypothetical protein A2231_12550 [Candidatus Firestonebacteria bacterium RIFOXYA2_FULL_40_8]